MNGMSRIAMGLTVVALAMTGCSHNTAGSGWITLIDGDKGMENFNRVGNANWRAEGGAIVADKGKGSANFLVSKNAYKDFELRAEFWAASDTNSGIFIRAADPQKPSGAVAYEVNIWDTRPDPTYATGAIVGVARVPVPTVHKAGGKWNVMEIRAKGSEMTIVLNGIVTSSGQDSRFASGPFALQFGSGAKDAPGGPIKWRKVEIRPL